MDAQCHPVQQLAQFLLRIKGRKISQISNIFAYVQLLYITSNEPNMGNKNQSLLIL